MDGSQVAFSLTVGLLVLLAVAERVYTLDPTLIFGLAALVVLAQIWKIGRDLRP